jgi:hypothetical protein
MWHMMKTEGKGMHGKKVKKIPLLRLIIPFGLNKFGRPLTISDRILAQSFRHFVVKLCVLFDFAYSRIWVRARVRDRG